LPRDEKAHLARRIVRTEEQLWKIHRNLLIALGIAVFGVLLLALAGRPLFTVGQTVLTADRASFGIVGALLVVIGFASSVRYILERTRISTKLAALKASLQE
jgi:hypothetical protein